MGCLDAIGDFTVMATARLQSVKQPDEDTGAIPSELIALCEKCSHRCNCKSPCRPVELLLCVDNRKPFERTLSKIAIVLPQKHQTRISEIQGRDDSPGELDQKYAERFFSTDSPSAFLDAPKKPKLKQTKIFIDAFFHKMPFEIIAKKYGVQPKTAQNLFENSRKRLRMLVKRMDDEERAGQVVSKPKTKIAVHIKAFLLYELFGLTTAQIGRILGVSQHTAYYNVDLCRDQILAQELVLIECTDQDREEARYKLNKLRMYTRDHYRKVKEKK